MHSEWVRASEVSWYDFCCEIVVFGSQRIMRKKNIRRAAKQKTKQTDAPSKLVWLQRLFWKSKKKTGDYLPRKGKETQKNEFATFVLVRLYTTTTCTSDNYQSEMWCRIANQLKVCVCVCERNGDAQGQRRKYSKTNIRIIHVVHVAIVHQNPLRLSLIKSARARARARMRSRVRVFKTHLHYEWCSKWYYYRVYNECKVANSWPTLNKSSSNRIEFLFFKLFKIRTNKCWRPVVPG